MARLEPTDRGLAGLLFIPLSWLYGAAVRLRLALYRGGILPTHTADGVRVISIGNLTVGGTGKTPVAIMLANMLPDCAIVSRGYGRESQEPVQIVSDGAGAVQPYPAAADEALVCAAALPATPVICSPRRIDGIRAAKERLGRGTVILDDAFSHLAAGRNKNLLLIDAMDPFGNHRLLPAGRLREPLSSASRADAVIITRVNLAYAERVAAIREVIAPLLRKGIPVFECEIAAGAVRGPQGEMPASEALQDKNVRLLSGIADPLQFEETVLRFGARIAHHHIFADHHQYTESELAEAVNAAKPGELLLTTQKDAVRMPKNFSARFRILTLRATMREPAAFAEWIAQ